MAAKNNTLYDCYNSAITVAETVNFSSIVSNTIVNANRDGVASEVGINLYGTTDQYNQVATNAITATSATTGYGIYENAGGSGAPTHNVFMSNSSLNMATPFLHPRWQHQQ